MSYQYVIPRLQMAIDHYRLAILAASEDEQDDLLRVVGQAEQVLLALRSGDVETVKLALYAFSRQVSDSYAVQPNYFKELAQEIATVKRILA